MPLPLTTLVGMVHSVVRRFGPEPDGPTIVIVRERDDFYCTGWTDLAFMFHADVRTEPQVSGRVVAQLLGECVALPSQQYWDKPMNKKGTPVTQDGLYRGAYRAGKHRGRDALRQVRPFTVKRYRGGQAVLREETLTGLNLHGPGGKPFGYSVANVSAGCVVLRETAVVLGLHGLSRDAGDFNLVITTDPQLLGTFRALLRGDS